MSLKFNCPHCDQHLEIEDELVGMQLDCPGCKRSFTVPSPAVNPVVTSETGEKSAKLISLERVSLAQDTEITCLLSQEQSGKYQSARPLGEGGMKVILKVRDKDTSRDIAMAVMQGDLQEGDSAIRFVREARITANLEHPNIVPVHELGLSISGAPFFTMKLVGGEDLHKIIGKLAAGDPAYCRKYNLQLLLNIFRKVCDAVAFAHSKGILHLDIKPENIQVGEFGEVLLLDWGLAKVVGEPDDKRSLPVQVLAQKKDDTLEQRLSDSTVEATIDGEIKGTPGYMAPEQATGQNQLKDQRTDIYSLGGVLYNILTYERPVEGDNINKILMNTAKGEIIHPRFRKPNHHIPTALDAVTMKAMALKPEDRYKKVEELSAEIDAYLGGFATFAEKAGLFTQIRLLMKRHIGFFGAVGVGLILLVAVVTGFIIRLNEEKELAQDRLSKFIAEQDARKADRMLAAPALISQAKKKLALKDTDNAAKDVDAALNFNPDLPEANLMKAQILVYKRQYADAISFLNKYLAVQPKDNDAAELLNLATEGAKTDFSTILAAKIAVVFEHQGLSAQARELDPGRK